MDFTKINDIIIKGEGLHIEFKEAANSIPYSFYETIVSFSNSYGGTIILGIDDDGNVIGIEKSLENKLKKDITTTLNNRNTINPPIFVQPESVLYQGKPILIIRVPVSSQVHSYNSKIFTRDFEADIDISDNQQRISDTYLRKRNFFTETKIYSHLTLDDLDSVIFDKALNIIRNYKSDHPWLLEDKMQILKDASLWRKDHETGKEGFTLAAALMFGKDNTIQSLLPAYKVEAMVRIENKDRYDDRINPPLRTNLIDTYLKLKSFLYKYLPEKFFIENDQRIDLRDKIFREVISNAIIHREYTSALATEIIISSEEVMITNPNKPVFHGIIEPKGFNPYPKNPNIRKFFNAMGWADEIGSGIRNTNKYLPLYVAGAKPLFYENDIFKTKIPLLFVSLDSFKEKWIKWLELNSDFSEHISSGLKNISLPPSLAKKIWEDILLYLVPSWHKIGTLLESLNWDKNQVVSESEIKNVPGWVKKSTLLLKKKNRYFIAILSLASEPIKSSDLLKAFNYKNEKIFRDNYLKPLRETGFIEFTIPGNPTDPKNKYKITEKGAAFLGGLLKE